MSDSNTEKESRRMNIILSKTDNDRLSIIYNNLSVSSETETIRKSLELFEKLVIFKKSKNYDRNINNPEMVLKAFDELMDRISLKASKNNGDQKYDNEDLLREFLEFQDFKKMKMKKEE